MTQSVPPYLVGYAVDALVKFCRKYGYEMEPMYIAYFAIAWRECTRFKLADIKVEGLSEIQVIDPEIDPSGKIVLVYSLDGINTDLTDELNETIKKATRNRWLSK